MVRKVLGGVTSKTSSTKQSEVEQTTPNESLIKSPSEYCDSALVLKVVGKARDNLRSLHVKLNNTTGVLPPNFSLCEGMVCVEMAFKLLNVDQKFDRNLAVQQIGANMKDYQSCFTEVVNMLGVSFSISLDDLILTFGCQGIRGSCEQLLEEYRKKFESRYPADILKKTDFNKPILKVAAFYITATQTYKFKVDLKKLAEETKTNTKSLCSVIDSMKETCGMNTFRVKNKHQKESQTETPKRMRDDLEIDNSTIHPVFYTPTANSDGLMGFDESKVVLKKKKVESESLKPETISLRSRQLLQKSINETEEPIPQQNISLKKTKQTKLNFFK